MPIRQSKYYNDSFFFIDAVFTIARATLTASFLCLEKRVKKVNSVSWSFKAKQQLLFVVGNFIQRPLRWHNSRKFPFFIMQRRGKCFFRANSTFAKQTSQLVKLDTTQSRQQSQKRSSLASIVSSGKEKAYKFALLNLLEQVPSN